MNITALLTLTAALAALAFASAVSAEDLGDLAAGIGQSENHITLLNNRCACVAVIRMTPWRLALYGADGNLLLAEAEPSAPFPNPDYERYNDIEDGIDRAYPGLPEVFYAPLAYLTDQWEHVTKVETVQSTDDGARFEVVTSDGYGAAIELGFHADCTLELFFEPSAPGVIAIEEAFALRERQPFYGGGQRFNSFNQRGRSIPLWISHGPNSNRALSTNEIAAPFIWTPAGWGLWADSAARGEINVGLARERRDALNLVLEQERLRLLLYTGSPEQIVVAHARHSGAARTRWPGWMWEPMVWQDSNTSTDSVFALVEGMAQRRIPLGAVWLDNPWDAGHGTFDFDPERFADPDALIDEVHRYGVRLMVWASPFITGPLSDFAAANGWLVTGTRPDNKDATYYPPRGLSPHLDFTHRDAVDWWKGQLMALIARGVDGLKMDRGEEDLSDDSLWHNAHPNRVNHNPYVNRYQRAAAEAFHSMRPDGDFVLIARGGWSGGSRYAAHWAADNLSLGGRLGLGQALNSLLSLSVSGFPVNGADIGGYAGTRQGMGEAAGNRPGLPTEAVYIRWAQLGALSPIMQTPVPPWWVSDRAVSIYRRYARLHSLLRPYVERWAQHEGMRGVPLVRPLPFAYPNDPRAVAVDDQYLFGPDLLVAPVVNPSSHPESAERTLYLPEGDWIYFWSGERISGPVDITLAVPLDELPLFVRSGANLPEGVLGADLSLVMH